MIAYRCMVVVGVILAVVLPVMLTGCGSGSLPTYRAGGRVVFPDGTTLDGGRVEFRSVQMDRNPVARGEIQPDGSFHLSTYDPYDGAVEGEHRVLVVPPPPPPDEDTRQTNIAVPMAIDPRFMQFDTSGLKYTVSQDAAKNQFVLQVDRPRR